jgi:hypothetical protein
LNNAKANLASPALTGTPTAPAINTINSVTTGVTGTNPMAGTLRDWGNQIVSMNTLRNAFAQQNYPVDSFYTQYPIIGQSTIGGMFPSTESPARLFGGTWTDMYLEETFFRTGNGLGARRGQRWDNNLTWTALNHKYTMTGATPGIEPDAIRNITGIAEWMVGNAGAALGDRKGAFFIREKSILNIQGGNMNVNSYDFHALGDTPTDSNIHPKNRLIKVWKRTA